MNVRALLAGTALLWASPAAAQAPAPQPADPATPVPAPNPADVASAEAIVAAVYEVISGDAGVKRDWDRFRSLFYPGARMVPASTNPQTGQVRVRVITPEDYVNNSGPMLEKDGFFEQELARRVDRYGNVAQVFSTYAARRKLSDAEPFMRGINSFQLVHDGKRWWVLNIAWSAETPQAPIPVEYLKGE